MEWLYKTNFSSNVQGPPFPYFIHSSQTGNDISLQKKLLKFLFKISKNFCQISKLSNSRNLFSVARGIRNYISHLFFGFTSFCMESQKQLYHNPPTHLPSTNPHNWACKNSPCPKSNANPSHTPPPAHSQRLQHDERLLKKLQSNAAEGSRLADTSFC